MSPGAWGRTIARRPGVASPLIQEPAMSLDEAEASLDWVRTNGWPSHEVDTVIGNRIYAEWLDEIRKERQDLCSTDRMSLLERIFQEMADRYGHPRGQHYAVLLIIELEMCAREDGMPYRAITH